MDEEEEGMCGGGEGMSRRGKKNQERKRGKLTPQFTFVQVTVSQPAAAISIDWVKPWMLEMSYAWGV